MIITVSRESTYHKNPKIAPKNFPETKEPLLNVQSWRNARVRNESASSTHDKKDRNNREAAIAMVWTKAMSESATCSSAIDRI